MKSIVTETFAFYTFDEGLFTQQRKTFCLQDGFVLAIRLRDLPQQEGKSILLKTEGFELSYTCKNAQDKEQFCEKADRPWIYANKNGVVRALEMKIESISPYENEAREMVCELLVELFNPVQKTAYFVYDGVRVFWVYDGEIVNANYPFGRLVIGENIRNCTALVKSWRLAPLAAVRKEESTQIVQKNMAFYSPRGYNVWAGDVMSFYKDDTYRLLYFYDRHHHSSRYGGGAHTVYQITTKDFVHWQECGELVPLDEQWKTLGTGNMFFYDGKYYYVHGWHTSRMVPVEKTGKMLLLEKSTQDEIHGASYAQIAECGLIPSGANFCVSCDGVHFESGEYQFHTVENPSVYVEKDGSLTLYGGYGGEGVWRASNIKGPWKRTGDFAMNKSPLKPSTECPCRFEYNGYKYLLVGGTGFWMTQKGDDAFKDVAKEGYDIYDGMFVPTVTQTGDNRLIYAGWLRGYGWGSVVVHRELIQGEKGRLYMRWLPELAPQKDELEEVTGDTLDDKSSYYIEADIEPQASTRIALRFIGERDSVLLLDSEKQTVQISNVEKGETYPKEILPLYLRAQTEELPHKPDIWGDFTLGRVDNIQQAYRLRVIIYYEPKLGASIIDAEIGGKRTLVSNRIDQTFCGISWALENAEIKNKKIYKII